MTWDELIFYVNLQWTQLNSTNANLTSIFNQLTQFAVQEPELQQTYRGMLAQLMHARPSRRDVITDTPLGVTRSSLLLPPPTQSSNRSNRSLSVPSASQRSQRFSPYVCAQAAASQLWVRSTLVGWRAGLLGSAAGEGGADRDRWGASTGCGKEVPLSEHLIYKSVKLTNL